MCTLVPYVRVQHDRCSTPAINNRARGGLAMPDYIWCMVYHYTELGTHVRGLRGTTAFLPCRRYCCFFFSIFFFLTHRRWPSRRRASVAAQNKHKIIRFEKRYRLRRYIRVIRIRVGGSSRSGRPVQIRSITAARRAARETFVSACEHTRVRYRVYHVPRIPTSCDVRLR